MTSGVRMQIHIEEPQQRALAASGRADKRNEFTRVDLEADMVEMICLLKETQTLESRTMVRDAINLG